MIKKHITQLLKYAVKCINPLCYYSDKWTKSAWAPSYKVLQQKSQTQVYHITHWLYDTFVMLPK